METVTVTDIDIKFWSMVKLLVKLVFAAIPAAIVVSLVWTVLVALIGAGLLAL